MRGSSLPKYLALYAKVFLVITTIYSMAFLIQGVILKELGQNLRFIVKSKINPLIYIIKI